MVKKRIKYWAESTLKVEPSGMGQPDWASSTQGYHEWTGTEQRRNEISFYLETKQR